MAAQGGGIHKAVWFEGHERVEVVLRPALGLPSAKSDSWGKIGWCRVPITFGDGEGFDPLQCTDDCTRPGGTTHRKNSGDTNTAAGRQKI